MQISAKLMELTFIKFFAQRVLFDFYQMKAGAGEIALTRTK